MDKAFLNWSSGKDAALALYYLQQNNAYQVDRLFTTVNNASARVSMQGIRRTLLQQQIQKTGLQANIVELPDQPDMNVYNRIMKEELEILKEKRYSVAAFGDIFLEDLKAYREQQLSEVGLKAIFPLWKKDTILLMNEFISLGFKAIVTVIRDDVLDRSFLGRTIDETFLHHLPDKIDPCGENGEFHTFCYDGPVFQSPVEFRKGKQFKKEYHAPQQYEKDEIGYWFQDLFSDEKPNLS